MGPKNKPIAENAWQVGGSGFSAAEDAAAYLVASGCEAILVDAGCGGATDLLLANVESTGVALDRVHTLLLTHCHFDHTGGAAEIRRRLGCSTAAHHLDASAIEAGDHQVTAADWYDATMNPCPIDVRLSGDELLPLESTSLQVIWIPGHSPGSLAFLMESGGKRVLFAQDVHGPLHPALHSNRDDYQASLRRLLDLRADILCEGHYGVFNGADAVARFIRGFLSE